MKSAHWNYLRTGILALIQGTLLGILLHPWLQLAAQLWKFTLAWGVLWAFLTTLISIFAAKKSAGRGKQGLAFLATAVLVSLILALVLGLPLALFLPLALASLYGGGRFSDYPKRASFTTDWGWGSLILIMSSVLETPLGFEVGLNSILLFFALGLMAVIFWNATALEQEGYQPDYGGLGRSIVLFVLAVGGLSLALGVLVSPAFLQGVVDLLHRAYLAISDALVFLIVRPFAWLLGPLFRWAENVEKHQLDLEAPEIDRTPTDKLPLIEDSLSPEALQAATWAGWIILVVALTLLAWAVLRKVLRRQNEEQTILIRETRESVFSRTEVLKDLKGAWQSLVKPLARLRQPKWYKGSDPILVIRTLYARFVIRATKEVPYGKGNTPNEYAREVSSNQVELNSEAIHTLTICYNEARYGERGGEEAVNSAQKAFREI